MKFKYIVETKDKDNALILKEYMEEEGDRFSLLNEAVYNKRIILSAEKRGVKALIRALRTQSMYPPLHFAEKIADAVSQTLKSKTNPSMEIILDDKELLDSKQRRRRTTVPVVEESVEVDDIMEEDDLMEERADETSSIKLDEELSDLNSDLNKVFHLDEVA